MIPNLVRIPFILGYCQTASGHLIHCHIESHILFFVLWMDEIYDLFFMSYNLQVADPIGDYMTPQYSNKNNADIGSARR